MSDNCSLLPELWEKIFCELSPTDILSAINSCQQWRAVISPQITTSLLPLVLPIIFDKINLPLHSFLVWRGVNKQSKFVVDSILEEDSSSANKYLESLSKLSSSWSSIHVVPARRFEKTAHLIHKVERCYCFANGSKIEKFLKKVASSSSSSLTSNFAPLLTKSTMLYAEDVDENDDDEEEQQQQREEQMRLEKEQQLILISSFGRQITALTFFIRGITLESCITHFHPILEHVPNLKILVVAGYLLNSWEEEESYDRLMGLGLPKLNQLELLDLQDFTDGLATFSFDNKISLSQILLKKYGQRITCLLCCSSFFEILCISFSNSWYTRYVPLLRTIRVKHVDSNSLDTLAQINWPIEELQFYGINDEDRSLKLEHFIKALNNFRRTLLKLELGVKLTRTQFALNSGEQQNSGVNFKKILPKLEKLSVELCNMKTEWFWPIVQNKFPNILELNIHCLVCDEEDMNCVLKGFEFLPKLERIWIICAEPKKGIPHRQLLIRRRKRLKLARKVGNEKCSKRKRCCSVM
ncbi:unnamed protein product [Orchesella dallaii]|uniref:F-box domain-containing protein n=1 Tax=Orchesella dallaii TaxID=48710 RepID=A0ABP1RVB0_9HEXA